MSVVDVHAHWLPARLGDEFARLSGKPVRMRHPDDHTDRIAALDDAGVDTQILGLGAIQPYWPDPHAAAEAARIANDLYAATCADHPRLRAFGTLPLPHTGPAIAETIRCLDDLGFAGIGLGCSALNTTLDDTTLDDLWATLDERSTVVHVHPGVRNDLALGIDEYPVLLGPVYGSPAETAVALTRLALKGTLHRYPNIRWIGAVMGGALWTGFDKLRHNLDAFAVLDPALDPDAVEADLRTLWFDTSGLDPVTAQAARTHAVAERLVFGSDAPWGAPGTVRTAVEQHLPDHAAAILTRGATLIP